MIKVAKSQIGNLYIYNSNERKFEMLYLNQKTMQVRMRHNLQ